MKIGFFGNTNNYPFGLALAMRALGHEVLFVIDRPEHLHRPEGRYGDISLPYPEWIVDESPLDLHVPLRSEPPGRRRAVALLQRCDAVVLNMLGPTLLAEVGRPAIVLLTGTDLELYANYGFILRYLRAIHGPLLHASVSGLGEIRRDALGVLSIVRAQRTGLHRATAVNYFARGLVARGDMLLDAIGVPDERRIFFAMTDLLRIRAVAAPRNPRPRILCVARLTWKLPGVRLATRNFDSELDFKGIDALIRGAGLFVRRTRIPLEIRLVRKGRSVDETRRLVEDEALTDCVTWLDEMTQAEILEECVRADIVVDQLGQAVPGMGTIDAMAIGRPVIANGRIDVPNQPFAPPCPLCHAATPQDVCDQLSRLVPDADERERIGRASREYAERTFSTLQAAKICLDRLGAS